MHSQVLLDLGVVVATSDQPLGGVQCVLRVGDGLAFSRHAHQTLAVSCKGDDWRSRPGSLCVLQHLRAKHNSFSQSEGVTVHPPGVESLRYQRRTRRTDCRVWLSASMFGRQNTESSALDRSCCTLFFSLLNRSLVFIHTSGSNLYLSLKKSVRGEKKTTHISKVTNSCLHIFHAETVTVKICCIKTRHRLIGLWDSLIQTITSLSSVQWQLTHHSEKGVNVDRLFQAVTQAVGLSSKGGGDGGFTCYLTSPWWSIPAPYKCLFILTLACFPSMTATHELVVPRSMPMTAPLTASDLQHTQPHTHTQLYNVLLANRNVFFVIVLNFKRKKKCTS